MDTAIVKYKGFVPVASDSPLSRPDKTEIKTAHAMFSKHNLKRTQSLHPLYARGFKQPLVLSNSDEALVARAPRKPRAPSTAPLPENVLELPLRKIATVGVLDNVLYLVARGQVKGKFNCHAFEVKGGATQAEELAFTLATYSDQLFRHNTVRSSSRGNRKGGSAALGMTDALAGVGIPIPDAPNQDADLKLKQIRNSLMLEDFGFGSALDDVEAALESPLATPGSTPQDTPIGSPSSRPRSPVSPHGSMLGGLGLLRSQLKWGSQLSIGSPFNSMVDLTQIPRGSDSAASVQDRDEVSSQTSSNASCEPCGLCMLATAGDSWVALRMCEHEFHSHCLQCWRGDGNNLCPTCHQPISHSLLYCEYVGKLAMVSPAQPTHDQVAAEAAQLMTRRGYMVRIKANAAYFKFENVGNQLVLRGKHFMSDVVRFDRLNETHISLTVSALSSGLSVNRVTFGDDDAADGPAADPSHMYTLVIFRCPTAREADNIYATLGQLFVSSDDFDGETHPAVLPADQ